MLVVALALAAVNGRGAEQLPRLVVVIVVDGLPQEQVLKYRDLFGEGGFKRLMREGAWFANAQYGHCTTYTAVGHVTILTGAYPYRHGVVGNDWWDRAAGKSKYCCTDAVYQLLDEPTKPRTGTSPRSLQVTTVGDELRLNTGLQSRVVTVALKDRSAIYLGGRLGKAFWYSKASGRFITSTYYAAEYPAWWKKWNEAKPQNRWLSTIWEPAWPLASYWRAMTDGCASRHEYEASLGLGGKFPHQVAGEKYYDALQWTPFADDLTLEFALAAMRAENLGKNPRGVPDLLAISFSSHDLINHLYGVESRESADSLVRTDRILAALFEALDKWVGLDNVLVTLTADHGFPDSPEFHAEVLKMDAGRIEPQKMLDDVNAALGKRFGEGRYALAWQNPTITLDAGKHNRDEVGQAAADFLHDYPGIHTVFTRAQLENGRLPATKFAQMAARSWHRQLSGELFVIQKPGWYLYNESDEYCVTHGSPWAYDTNVPLMFMGKPWIKPGRHLETVEVVDLAATLAALLEIRPPCGCEGRVLGEALR